MVNVMNTLPQPIDKFLEEMTFDFDFGPGLAAGFRKAFIAIDREADDNYHALQFMQVVSHIASLPSVRARFEAIDHVATAPKGNITVTVKKLTAPGGPIEVAIKENKTCR
jgi:hypothetical protein